MRVVRDAAARVETWREGVETRVLASTQDGSSQLAVFEQECAPGTGAPPHLHAVEEVLRVLAGQAEVVVGADSATLGPGDAVIIPAGVAHAFTNTGHGPLRVLAILAAPVFEARYLDPPGDRRRWGP